MVLPSESQNTEDCTGPGVSGLWLPHRHPTSAPVPLHPTRPFPVPFGRIFLSASSFPTLELLPVGELWPQEEGRGAQSLTSFQSSSGVFKGGGDFAPMGEKMDPWKGEIF